ncbi:MAG: M23 family metallopeptidase, partial [Sphingobacteriales bacterium]
GEVIRADANAVSGKFIVIRHGKFTSHYAHLSSLLVRNQDAVSRGQLIGLSGNSGRTTGPHLHFALSYANIKIDAIRFFTALIRPDTVPP